MPFIFSWMYTLPETNIAPENRPLGKEIPIENPPFSGAKMLVLGSGKCLPIHCKSSKSFTHSRDVDWATPPRFPPHSWNHGPSSSWWRVWREESYFNTNYKRVPFWLFRVFLGDEISYPVMWELWFHKPEKYQPAWQNFWKCLLMTTAEVTSFEAQWSNWPVTKVLRFLRTGFFHHPNVSVRGPKVDFFSTEMKKLGHSMCLRGVFRHFWWAGNSLLLLDRFGKKNLCQNRLV